MLTVTALCRALGGTLALVLAAYLLYGCSSTAPTSLTGDQVALTSTITDPAAPTADTLATALVKPANPDDGVAVLEPPAMDASAGSSISYTGTAPAMAVELGNQGVTSGTLALASRTPQQALLPMGDHALRLSAGTELNLDDLDVMATRSVVHGLRITDLHLQFSVRRGLPPSWTLPSTYKLNLTKQKRQYMLSGSSLVLRWKGRLSVPPKDGNVALTVTLYQDAKLVAQLSKTVPVVNNIATFTSGSSVLFNRAGISLDARDVK